MRCCQDDEDDEVTPAELIIALVVIAGIGLIAWTVMGGWR